MAAFSLFMMSASLILEGVMLWMRDGATPELPSAFFVSDVIWCITLLSLFFFWRHPWVTLVSAWALFVSFAVVLMPFYEHMLGWFLYRHSVEIANVTFAHLGFYFRRRQQR